MTVNDHTTDCRVFSGSNCDCGLPYDRIAQLEAALVEKEAALAAAHEALNKALSGWARRAPGTLGWYCRCCSGEGVAIDGIRHHKDCPVLKLDAPALQHAAKLDRLRREVVGAVEAVDRAEDEYTEACGAMGEQSGGGRARALGRRMDDARERRDTALAALRAEEEKG